MNKLLSTSAFYKLQITNKVSTQQDSLQSINTDTLTTVRCRDKLYTSEKFCCILKIK